MFEGVKARFQYIKKKVDKTIAKVKKKRRKKGQAPLRT